MEMTENTCVTEDYLLISQLIHIIIPQVINNYLQQFKMETLCIKYRLVIIIHFDR